jgi:hypothetical protein
VVELALDAGYGLSLVPSRWDELGAGSVTTLSGEALAGGRGRGMNGVHRPEGIFIACGPGFQDAGVLETARIADAAPTVLRSLGIPWDESLDGLAVDPTAYDSDEEARVAERLRGLGYLE